MAKSDLTDALFSALALLTRIPVPDHRSVGASGCWAWPVAGLAIALPAGLLLPLGLPAGVTAALILAIQAMLTGAMHEDGLADCADGFWGGQTSARRLEIMKDSRIGSYGVLALLLVTLVRWSALTSLIPQSGAFWAILATAALSRAPMALVIASLDNARPGGLSRAVGRPGLPAALAGAAIASAIALPAFGFCIIPALALLIALTAAVALTAKVKIGGQTGDVLGASQQLSEAALLAFLAA